MKKILTSGLFFLIISYQILAQTPWQNYKDELKKKSEAGDVEAQGMLGVCLFWDDGGMPLSAESGTLLEKSAQNGSCIGNFYYTFRILSKNENLNVEKLEDLANSGNEVAQFIYAEYLIRLNKGKMTEAAKKYLEKSSDKSFYPADLWWYLKVSKDDSSIQKLEKASDNGYKCASAFYAMNLFISKDKLKEAAGSKMLDNLANESCLTALDFLISLFTNGDSSRGISPDMRKVNYCIVKKYLTVTTENNPAISGSPGKEEILGAMISDLIIFNRQPDLKFKEINLKRGNKLQSEGFNGIPKGTEIFPIKISPIIKGSPVTAETVYYFYKDEFNEWKFKQ